MNENSKHIDEILCNRVASSFGKSCLDYCVKNKLVNRNHSLNCMYEVYKEHLKRAKMIGLINKRQYQRILDNLKTIKEKYAE